MAIEVSNNSKIRVSVHNKIMAAVSFLICYLCGWNKAQPYRNGHFCGISHHEEHERHEENTYNFVFFASFVVKKCNPTALSKYFSVEIFHSLP